ncbi:PDZ domain-containing protein [Pontiella sulfatireligans]|uniref:PDZ domain-containing protein n=1 Tax=Pontiella sulfatireligans TaxID=2750658 RepID=A0A6C2UHB9_9BACT|nr:PDZ domain-containing protein [Pontiella sulfatireligans]VGO18596.1 hypothetical protein SCARR_00649 [Pontiella sulfatireligans]
MDDVLLKVNGSAVSGVGQMKTLLEKAKRGTSLKMKVMRNQEVQEFTCEIP